MSKQTIAVVSLSGGKDSTATALLALDEHGRDNCRFVFADTGNEHALTYEYVHDYLPTVLGPVDTVKADFADAIARKRKYCVEKWPAKGVPDEIVQRSLAVLHPTGNPFLDMCLVHGRFPSRMVKFCTQELKRHPLERYQFDLMEQGFAVESWRGIRRDESRNRADAKDRENTPEGWVIVHPIAAWTAQETIDFVKRRGVKHNPLYSQGMHRVGCMPCINCGKDELLEISKRFPEHIDKIREWERIVSLACKIGASSFFGDLAAEGEAPGDTFDRLRIDSRVKWAQTARGGRQYDFTRTMEGPSCSSIYGLCE